MTQKVFWKELEVVFLSEKKRREKTATSGKKVGFKLDSTKSAVKSVAKSAVDLCGFCRIQGVPVSSEGSGKLMIVGAYPDFKETSEGRPFVGAGGIFLKNTLTKLNFLESDLYFTYILKCSSKFKELLKSDIKKCGEFLLEEINDIRPKLIVLLGEIPLRFFFNKKLLSSRGLVLFKGDYKFFVTHSPEYILQESSGSEDCLRFEKDFYSIFNIFYNVISQSDKNREKFICKSIDDVKAQFLELDRVTDVMKNQDPIPWGLKKVSLDIETFALKQGLEKTALDPWSEGFRVESLSISYFFGGKKKAFCVPLEHPESLLNLSEVLVILKYELESSKWKIIGQNIKWDLKVLLVRFGLNITSVYFDTLPAHVLIAGKQKSSGLERMSLDYLNVDPYKYIIKDKGCEVTALNELASMNMDDCINTMMLAEIFEGNLRLLVNPNPYPGLWDYYCKTIIPGVSTLKKIEARGAPVDRPYLESLQKETEEKLRFLENKLYSYKEVKDKGFNLNSNLDLQTILFKEFKFSSGRKTKTGFSVDKHVVEFLYEKNRHPFLNDLIEFRQLSKLLSTYIDPYLKIHIKSDGRVHGNYNQHVSSTGRLSMEKPNLQNIPVRIGSLILRAFIALTGWKLVVADYNQIELRVLAASSKDPKLTEAFTLGKDIHRATASEVFNIPYNLVTSEQRQDAKSINFGIVYGQTPQGLASALGWDLNRANKFIKEYLERFHFVKEYMDKTIAEFKSKGYVLTLFGRRIYISGPNVSHNERRAINNPIQGTASDVNTLALIECDRIIESEGFKFGAINTIHDSGIYEVPDEEMEFAPDLIKEVMEKIELDFMGDIPLNVDLSIGNNLGEAKFGEEIY